MITEELRKIVDTLGGESAAGDDTVSELLARINAAFESGGSGGGASDVIRVPFTLTMNDETGAITGTTDAVLADALAAKAAGKVLIADAALVFSGTQTQYFCAVMSGHSGDGAALTGVAEALSSSGDKLELYVITWTAEGVAVTGKKVAVTD